MTFFQRHLDQFALGLVLIACGGVAFIWLPAALGGTLLGAGLGLLISTVSTRRAVSEQYKKEANLRRKQTIYGPLHAELVRLGSSLHGVIAKSSPYPSAIASGAPAPTLLVNLFDAVLPPEHGWSFTLWPEFRADFRADDFSPATRKRLDTILERANAYNAAIASALGATQQCLSPIVQHEIERIVESADYKAWLTDHPDGVAAMTLQPNDGWYAGIRDSTQSGGPAQLAASLSFGWLRGWMPVQQPSTLGWLVAGQCDQAVATILGTYLQGATGIPPEPWLRTIVEDAWPVLDQEPSYTQVRALTRTLQADVREVTESLAHALRTIRDLYEGGEPLV